MMLLNRGNSNSRFLTLMSILICAFLVSLLILPKSQFIVFFRSGADFEADFFNVLRYVVDLDPYFNTVNGCAEKCALPLWYILLYPFTLLCDYSNMSLIDCYGNITAMLSMAFYLIVQCILFIYAYFQFSKETSQRIWLLATLMLSSVFLFALERGNLHICMVALIMLFLAWYQSESKRKRYIALISLCLVSVIKIYPVLLGLLLLKEKQYKDILFCVCLSLLLTFMPFLLLEHGLNNIPQLIDNIANNSENSLSAWRHHRFGLVHYAYAIRDLSIFPARIATGVQICLKILMTGLSIVALSLSFSKVETWKAVALIIFTIILFPANSGFYVGVYLFPVIILFFSKQKSDNYEFIYVILFCLILNPLQIGSFGFISISAVISNLAAILMWIILIFQSFFFNKTKSVE